MDASNPYCRNCEQPTAGAFCPSCGQRTSVHKVTFRETLEDFNDAVFSVNAPFFRTIRALLVNPGGMFRDYLSGKRKSYYKPVSFFVLMTVLYLLFRSIMHFNPFEGNPIDETKVPDANHVSAAREYMLANINKMLFIFTFILGLMLKLFFYKRYSLAEFLAVSFYLIGAYTFFGLFNVLLVSIFGNSWQIFAILVMFLYFIYAMISFLQRPKLWIVVKGILAYVIAFLCYAILAFGLSYLIVKNGS